MSLSLILSCLLFCVALSEFYPPKSGVINLDIENFDEYIGKNDYDVNIIEFYAPWCGHCQKLKPDYIQLAKQTKGIVNVYAVNADEEKNRPLASKFGVQGFPTLVTVIGQEDPEPYQYERSAKAMKQFLFEKLPNFSKKVSFKNLDKFLNRGSDKPRALIISKKRQTSPVVKRLSALVKGYIHMAETTSKDARDVAKKYDISIGDTSKLIVFPKNEKENPIAFTGNSKSFRELQSFLYSFTDGQLELNEDKLDMILDESCFQQKCVKKGLCVILINGEEQSDNLKNHNTLKEIQESSSDASLFSFMQINGGDNYEWITSVFGQLDMYYSNLVILAPQKRRYAHYVGSYTKDTIQGWISGILRGKTRTTPVAFGQDSEFPKLSTETELCKPKPKPKPKTKPKKKPQTQPRSNKYGKNGWKNAQPGGGSDFITHLTPQNFMQEIMQSTQPAILEFYAPWCGHCKNLAPQYALAANHLQGMVIFGGIDCDAEANKQLCGQFGIKGFPTLKTFPPGIERKQKQGPKDYQGARDAKAIEQAAVSLLYAVKIPNLVNLDDYQEFVADENYKLLLFTNKRKPPTMIRALSAKFNEVNFAYVTQSSKKPTNVEDIIAQLNVSDFPSIYVFNENSDEALLYTGKKGFVDLEKFVSQLINGKLDESLVTKVTTNEQGGDNEPEMCTSKEDSCASGNDDDSESFKEEV